jgi:predicted ATPase
MRRPAAGLIHHSDRGSQYGPLPPLAIPTSLHASLTARLDRLGSVRQVAQIGAAFGRWFRYTALRAVCGQSDDELQASLARLAGSELVSQSGTPPDAVYTFKHALVQEAAYGSLLRNTRRRLHKRIAEAMGTHFPELKDSQPEFFARHYTEAGLIEEAIFYWSKAARISAERSAMAEAAAQFQKVLDQLALLPDDRARQRQELEFYAALGAVLQPSKASARRKQATLMPAHENYGNGWALPRSFSMLRAGSRSFARSAVNSIWRSAWIRICCVSAKSATILLSSFWLTTPVVEP